MSQVKHKWAVYWKADDGDHFMGHTWAVSAKQAVNQVHYRQIADEPTIMRDNMFAKIVKYGIAQPSVEQGSLFTNNY